MQPIKRLLVMLTLIVSGLAGSLQAAAPPADSRERAVSALEEDLKADPNNADLWSHLGFAYRKMNQIDKAQGAFEKSISLNSQNKEALFMLGLIYESKHQKDAAEMAWNDYLKVETDPDRRAVAEKHIHHLTQ